MRVVKASFRLLFLLSLMCAPLFAQSVLKALSTGASSAQAAIRNTDPLGRDTPRGTLTGFMEAAQKGDNERAAEYLQLPHQENEIDSNRVVQDLKALLDHAYVGRLASITANPDLAFDPQLEPNHERVGEFTVNGKELPLLVVRVPDGNSGHLWLIAWGTLSKTADLANDVRAHEVEQHLPHILVRVSILSIPLWVWLAFLLLIPIALLAGVAAVGSGARTRMVAGPNQSSRGAVGDMDQHSRPRAAVRHGRRARHRHAHDYRAVALPRVLPQSAGHGVVVCGGVVAVGFCYRVDAPHAPSAWPPPKSAACSR